jgi:hypothetical protein
LSDHLDSEKLPRKRYNVEQAEPLTTGRWTLNYQAIWAWTFIFIGAVTSVVIMAISQDLFGLVVLLAVVEAGTYYSCIAQTYAKLGHMSVITWAYRYGRKRIRRKKKFLHQVKPRKGELFHTTEISRRLAIHNDSQE